MNNEKFFFVKWNAKVPKLTSLPMEQTKEGWQVDGLDDGVMGKPRLVSNFKPCDNPLDAVAAALEREKFELDKLIELIAFHRERIRNLEEMPLV